MNFDIKFMRNLLMVSDHNLKQFDTFLPELRSILTKENGINNKVYKKLMRKMNGKLRFKNDKLAIFINKYSGLLNELESRNILNDLIFIIFNNDYKLFNSIYCNILNNIESKEQMISNINYFIRFGADRIDFVDDLNQTHSVLDTLSFVSTFYTDGEIEWNGKGKVCKTYDTKTDLFKIKNANYVLSYVISKNTNQKNDIVVTVSNLLFNKPLPTYDVLHSSPYCLIDKDKLNLESDSIDTIKELLDYERRIIVLKKEMEITLDKVECSSKNIELESISNKVQLLSDIKDSLSNLTEELVIYYDECDVISKDKMKRLTMFNEKA